MKNLSLSCTPEILEEGWIKLNVRLVHQSKGIQGSISVLNVKPGDFRMISGFPKELEDMFVIIKADLFSENSKSGDKSNEERMEAHRKRVEEIIKERKRRMEREQ